MRNFNFGHENVFCVELCPQYAGHRWINTVIQIIVSEYLV